MSAKQPAVDGNRPLGIFSAFCVLIIWSSWLVISRAGALTSLTAFDLAAIRYGVSGLVALPIVLYFKPWREMSLGRIVTVAFLLGPIYVFFIFQGFEYAPASHGGIFMNGLLPIFTFMIAWIWLSEHPTFRQIIASLVILFGVALTVGDENFDFRQTWSGDVMFIIAALMFCLYMQVSRLWSIKPLQVVFCSAVINAIFYVPIWYFFLPSGIGQTESGAFWLQFLFQGFVPNFVGLIMIALAARHIGPVATSTAMSIVPATGAVFGLIFLGEKIGAISWVGIAILTIGILLMSLKRRAV